MNVTAMVLAGGAGTRLRPLTSDRAKPAVPFGGGFRLIDFTLINCLSSGVRKVHVLTQHLGHTVRAHVERRWAPVAAACGGFISILPPRERYTGTADAVRQNASVLDCPRPDAVLVLSADHVYRADYARLIELHLAAGSDATVLVDRVPSAEACRFGVVSRLESGRILSFIEKPAAPGAWASQGICDINAGVYCFRPSFLGWLLEAGRHGEEALDFGRDILPAAVERGQVDACPLASVCPDPAPYWRDVGTLESYFEAGMDLLGESPRFDLADARWSRECPFWDWTPTRSRVLARGGGPVRAGSNLTGSAARLESTDVVDCIISQRARVGRGARLDRCILLPGAEVGEGARLRNVIVEEGARVEAGASMGLDPPETSGQGLPVVVLREAAGDGAGEPGKILDSGRSLRGGAACRSLPSGKGAAPLS
jgi:glucose-1-phosphate adenylyltransferase